MQYGTRLFNDGWSFAKAPLTATLDTLPGSFAPVALPHDWLIAQAGDLYEDGTGWYRRTLTVDDTAGQHLRLRFEGVYMDSTVYVNRQQAAEWKYGYSSFDVDLTPWLHPGGNEILVRVAFQAPNSRWYSGAGIYRNVWLCVEHQAARLVADGSYITAIPQNGVDWALHADTELALEEGADPAKIRVQYRLLPCGGGAPLLDTTVPVQPGGATAALRAVVAAPQLWQLHDPCCYRLEVALWAAGALWQQHSYTVGFRTIAFDPAQGFLLNGQKQKLNGVCEHHDLGCLGAAYNSAAMRRRLLLLRDMGVNALRMSHNMPAPDVMELADELGFLVVSEAFDMWETAKNSYDYARFFPQWYKKDVASWVRRDRNHPSLIMWSIGNEIYDTHAGERGQALTRLLRDEVRLHDPATHAGITLGSNYMPWENAQKCADILKIAGYNYAEKYYDAHHQAHPDWVIYGSETASVVSSRGIYHFPFHKQLLADEDRQCSSLGNSTTSWGAKSAEACIIAERDRPYSCGQFIWTGFDYIGEPTPYHTRSAYFGQLDTAGFPKDGYYIYKAAWTDCATAPMVHLFPYWDFNVGQWVDVRVASNAPRVELFLNGESQGDFAIDHRHGNVLVGHWRLRYTPGTLCAVAYDDAGREIARDTRCSFGETAALCLRAQTDALRGDGQDLAFVTVTAKDADGNVVENAVDRVTLTVDGAGYLAGVDNGDSTDTDGYKTNSRRLFSGKLLAVVASDGTAGSVTVTANAPGISGASLTLPVHPAGVRPGIGLGAGRVQCAAPQAQTDYPVRAIRLNAYGDTALNQDHRSVTVTARLCPAHAADRSVRWCVVDEGGVPCDLAEVQTLTPDGLQVRVSAQSDGVFRLRCLCCAGTAAVRVISELDFTVQGLGKRWLDPYGFVAGALYDYSVGDVGNGNEHGVATARQGESRVGFHGIDFGDFGSDEIVLPIFALDDTAYNLQIWEGMPDEAGSTILADVVYQMPAQWNVYQTVRYRLNKRLCGVTSLCFVLHKKLHIKGFSFTRQQKAFAKLAAAQCSKVYGDSFVRKGQSIKQIGNNVTLVFEDMNFGDRGAARFTVCGATPLPKNTIQLRFSGAQGESVALAEFMGDGAAEQSFAIPRVCGAQTVSLVFLPGCNFDLDWFRFETD